jgi:hypothetical protein
MKIDLNTQNISKDNGDPIGTGSVDLSALDAAVAGLDQAVVLQGEWDASSGSFPGTGTAQAGHSWIVSVTGTVDSVDFTAGDRIIAIVDDASTSTYAANWNKSDYSDLVQSVAGKTGNVTLDADDLSDGATNAIPTLAQETAWDAADTHATGDGSDHQDVIDLATLTGVAANSTDLGTFTGSTIADSQTLKAAIQALESAHEISEPWTYVTNATEFEAALAAGKLRILMEEGDYQIQNTLVPYDNLHIRGKGSPSNDAGSGGVRIFDATGNNLFVYSATQSETDIASLNDIARGEQSITLAAQIGSIYNAGDTILDIQPNTLGTNWGHAFMLTRTTQATDTELYFHTGFAWPEAYTTAPVNVWTNILKNFTLENVYLDADGGTDIEIYGGHGITLRNVWHSETAGSDKTWLRHCVNVNVDRCRIDYSGNGEPLRMQGCTDVRIQGLGNLTPAGVYLLWFDAMLNLAVRDCYGGTLWIDNSCQWHMENCHSPGGTDFNVNDFFDNHYFSITNCSQDDHGGNDNFRFYTSTNFKLDSIRTGYSGSQDAFQIQDCSNFEMTGCAAPDAAGLKIDLQGTNTNYRIHRNYWQEDDVKFDMAPSDGDLMAWDDGNSYWNAISSLSADFIADGSTNAIPTLTQETNWDNHLGDTANPHSTNDLGSNLSSTTNDLLSDTGSITIGGTGGTNNETLTLDFESTANEVHISTATGVSAIVIDASIFTVAGNLGFNSGTGPEAYVGSTAPGILAFNGLGGTNNESLIIDLETTANTIGISSDTGATLVDFGTLNVAGANIDDTNWDSAYTHSTGDGSDHQDVADLATLSGVAANSTDLGTFTGTTIADAQTIKAAIQALETAHEAISHNQLGSNLSSTTNDILSDTGVIQLGGTGGTNNETLSLDFETTANRVLLTTASGVFFIDTTDVGISLDCSFTPLNVEADTGGSTIFAWNKKAGTGIGFDFYTSENTGGEMYNAYHDTTTHTGDVFRANLAAGSGDFTGNLINYTLNSVDKFIVDYTGQITVGSIGTSVTQTEWDAAYTHGTGDGSDHQDVADLATLSGVAANSTDLGTFTGTTIADTQTIKAALQALETAVETKLTDGTDIIDDTHIDWGTGANQVSADDIPDGSTNAIITLTQETNFETAYTHSQATHHFDTPEYGSMYITGNSTADTSNSTPGTFDKITRWGSDGASSTNVTPDSTTNDDILVATAGTYEISAHVSFAGSTNHTYTFRVYKEGVAVTELTCQRKTATADVGSASLGGIISVSANDNIDLRIACDNASSSFTLQEANINLKRVA